MKLRMLLFLVWLPCQLAAHGLRPLVWVIDPGHGGHDHGTEGRLCMEKDVNLRISQHLVKLLAKHKPGIRVIVTRDKDEFVSLEARCRKANRANADLFLSIHVNSAPNKLLMGTESFYARRGATSNAVLEGARSRYIEKSELLALLLQKNYYDAGRQADRGIKATKLFVTANVMMPSVLTEVGFMSNREDEIYLASETGQQEIARMLFNALMEYYTTTQGKTYKKTLKTLRHSNGTRSGVDALRLEVKERTAKRKDKEQPAKKEEPVVQNPPKASDNPEKKDTLATADNRAQQPIPADAQESSTAIPVFSIQLFSNSTEMKPDDKRLKGVSPVTFVKVGDTFKCLYQGTTDYQQAKEHLKKVREKFPDAFIVAYLGEKPISTAEALELVRRAR